MGVADNAEPKAEDEVRNRIIRVRLTATWLERAEELAKREGVTMEDLAYAAIKLAVVRGSTR